MPAQGWRQRRITISADIKAADAMHASPWLKTQQQNKTLMFDDATEQDLLGTVAGDDGWVRRTITLPVAAEVTHVGFKGDVAGCVALRYAMCVSRCRARHDCPEAARLLNRPSASLQQTQTRKDLAWQVLEPQLRLFASGAQSAAGTGDQLHRAWVTGRVCR
jgi:hypothetical protein